MNCSCQNGYTVFHDTRGLVGLMDMAHETGICPMISPTDVWLTLVRQFGLHCKTTKGPAKDLLSLLHAVDLDVDTKPAKIPVVLGPRDVFEAHLINGFLPERPSLTVLFSEQIEGNTTVGFADMGIQAGVAFNGEPNRRRVPKFPTRNRSKTGVDKIMLCGERRDWELLYNNFCDWEDFGVVGWMDRILLHLDRFRECRYKMGFETVGATDLYQPSGPTENPTISGWINDFYPVLPNAGRSFNPHFSSDGKEAPKADDFLGAGQSRLFFPVIINNSLKEFDICAGSTGWYYDPLTDSLRLSYGWTCEEDR